MLKKVVDVTSQDFGKGLNTQSDIFKVGKDQTTNCMNVKFNFDGSVEKRLGSTTTNSVALSGTAGAKFTTDVGGTLTSNLISIWSFEETTGTRKDGYGTNDLSEFLTVSNTSGILGNCGFYNGSGGYLYRPSNATLQSGTAMYLSSWFYLVSTGQRVIASKRYWSVGGLGASTKLALHMDGNEGGTIFTDVSVNTLSITTIGTIHTTSAQKVFGTASAVMDGDGDYLTTPTINLSDSDFTIDFWMRSNDVNKIQTMYEQYSGGGTNNNHNIQIYNKKLSFYAEIGGSQVFWYQGTKELSSNSWYHVAFIRKNKTLYCYIDGKLDGSCSASSSINTGASVKVGGSHTSTQSFDGYIDEFRIDLSARWDSEFTIPSQAYFSDSETDFEYSLMVDSDNKVAFGVSTASTTIDWVKCESFGAVTTATWYHALGWVSNNSSCLGVAVNLNANTLVVGTDYLVRTGSGIFIVGATSGQSVNYMNGRIDEMGYWKKEFMVPGQEATDLYNSGNANKFTRAFANHGYGIFDFGATNIRWAVVACGTGLYASSDGCANFTAIASERSATYHTFERSKAFMIDCTDAYDTVLGWAGSGGTNCVMLCSNAPLAKIPVSFQGYTILLNSIGRKRGFYWEDQNTQATGKWENVFDLPSTYDDEITAGFVLRKRLYVSTKYKLFRLTYIGGNPDWSYVDIKDWGFVPRTVKKVFVKDVGEVAIGFCFDRRFRMFDGSDDRILSDNIENDNGMCDFALEKISQIGSGLLVSYAEVDPNEITYKCGVALGVDSLQATHFINFDARTLAWFPDSNRPFNAMGIINTANMRYVMCVDRSGFVWKINDGVKDLDVPVDDYMDSSFIYEKTPSQINKGHKIDMYFKGCSSGELYYRDRTDFNGTFKDREVFTLDTAGKVVQVVKSFDTPKTYNVYQYELSSSMGTAEPWKLNRTDYFLEGMGIGGNK